MEPEEMDLIELLEDVAIQPSWRVKPEFSAATLSKGQQGMVVHRQDLEPPLYDVEFIDPVTKEPVVLAVLRGDQVRVVESDTLRIE